MSIVTDNAVYANDYNFTEKKSFVPGKTVPILVTNGTTRTLEFGETVFEDGWIGDVMEQDGIAAGESGYINVNPDRIISTNQVDATDSFTAGSATVYFYANTDSAAGEFKDTSETGAVAINVSVIGSVTGGTTDYLEYKPPYQDGSLTAAA